MTHITGAGVPSEPRRPGRSVSWDPTQYARFADHRSRPFADLMARVAASSPSCVVDLGCGDGPLTLSLARRWPDARVVGLDSSPEMLAAARGHDTDARVEWVQADLRTWDPASLGARADILVSNAALQWVPGHLELIGRWVSSLAPGAWLAVQVPGNHSAPSHRLIQEVAADHPRRAEVLAALQRPRVPEPAEYLELLAGAGADVDAWETTYLHVLDPEGQQSSPVLEWVRSTALRPVLAALTDPDERDAFIADYARRLDAAYPRSRFGVVLPFRRIFAVAHMKED